MYIRGNVKYIIGNVVNDIVTIMYGARWALKILGENTL